jgi:hypothetical protein
MNFSYSLAVVCLIFLVLAAVFFKRKRKVMKAAEAAGVSQPL